MVRDPRHDHWPGHRPGGLVAAAPPPWRLGLVAVTGGSLVAAYLAWRVGDSIGQAELARAREAAVDARVEAPLRLRVTGLDSGVWWRPYLTGVAVAQALAAAVVYTTLAAFSTHPDLRPSEPAGAGSREATGSDGSPSAGPYPPRPSLP